jgi:hypothetical protein
MAIQINFLPELAQLANESSQGLRNGLTWNHKSGQILERLSEERLAAKRLSGGKSKT